MSMTIIDTMRIRDELAKVREHLLRDDVKKAIIIIDDQIRTIANEIDTYVSDLELRYDRASEQAEDGGHSILDL